MFRAFDEVPLPFGAIISKSAISINLEIALLYIIICHSEKTENQAISENFRLIQNLF